MLLLHMINNFSIKSTNQFDSSSPRLNNLYIKLTKQFNSSNQVKKTCFDFAWNNLSYLTTQTVDY